MRCKTQKTKNRRRKDIGINTSSKKTNSHRKQEENNTLKTEKNQKYFKIKRVRTQPEKEKTRGRGQITIKMAGTDLCYWGTQHQRGANR